MYMVQHTTNRCPQLQRQRHDDDSFAPLHYTGTAHSQVQVTVCICAAHPVHTSGPLAMARPSQSASLQAPDDAVGVDVIQNCSMAVTLDMLHKH